MKIYIVMGESGEYSDRNVWDVKAFKNEIDARKFVEDCTKEGNILKLKYEYEWYDSTIHDKHPLDPDFKIRGNDFNYWIEETELED